MALKNIYNEIENESKNKIKDKNMVSMPFSDFCEEHLELIKTLRQGTREELIAEAQEQEDELKAKCKELGVDYNTIEEENEDA